jgi:hypothetical protein
MFANSSYRLHFPSLSLRRLPRVGVIIFGSVRFLP